MNVFLNSKRIIYRKLLLKLEEHHYDEKLSSHSDLLFYVLNHFQPALKSVDIRTFAVCFSAETGWENLITSIIISEKTVEKIKAEYELLPQVRNNYCSILYEAQPFNFQIFEEIANGEMKFLPIYGNNKVKARKADFGNLKVESCKDWNRNPPQIVLKTRVDGDSKDRKKLWDTAYEQRNLPNEVGFPNFEEMIKYCLVLDDYHQGIAKDFEVTIIPPAKIESFQISRKKASVKIHNPDQLKNLQVNFALRNHPVPVWIKPTKIAETSENIELELKEILPLDILTVKLIHNKTRLRLDELEISVPLENVVEPFLKSFDAFCSLDCFEKMLFKPELVKGDAKYNFESAISWLLSLSGFNVIHLNSSGRSFDVLRVGPNKYDIGCSDIVAYEENKKILLADCDTGPVEEKKVKRLEQAKKQLRAILEDNRQLPITAVLFTPRDFTKQSPSIDVMIADLPVIKRIFEAVIKGDRENAKSVLNYTGF